MSERAPEPKCVSHRNHIAAFDEIADQMMDALPRETLNLADDETRERFRSWAVRSVRTVAFQMEWAYRKATDRALAQATSLMADPEFYTKRKERRRRQMEERRTWEAEHDKEQKRRTRALRGLVKEGKLKAMPGLKFRFEKDKKK